MKIWNSFGSEHSENLMLIGTFTDATKAEEAKEIINELSDYACENFDHFDSMASTRLPEDVMEALRKHSLYSISTAEFFQLAYDHNVDVDSGTLVIRTDEIDVSVFMKLVIRLGGKIEIYSNHDHKEGDQDESSAEGE